MVGLPKVLISFLTLFLCGAVLAESPTITHGPILGRPGPDSMRVWLRTSEPTPFRILASRDANFANEVIAAEGNTTAAADGRDTESEESVYAETLSSLDAE